MEPYEYKDDDRDVLTISEGDNASALVKTTAHGVIVPAARVGGAAEALYRACGLPAAPVILAPSTARFDEDGRFRFGDFGFKLYPEGVAPSLPGVEAKAVPPAALRELAAHLVALADHAEANPEPGDGDVDALVTLMREAAPANGTGIEDVARRLLRSGKVRLVRDGD